jgi:hypothetical protein
MLHLCVEGKPMLPPPSVERGEEIIAGSIIATYGLALDTLCDTLAFQFDPVDGNGAPT